MKTLNLLRFLLVTWTLMLAGSVVAAPILTNWGNYGGHLYQVYIDANTPWVDANSFANATSGGYLATITSAGEDLFLFNLTQATPGVNTQGSPQPQAFLLSEVWVGGSQDSSATSAGDGWNWVNGEGSIDGSNAGPGYANWLSGEPNDAGGTEQYLAIDLLAQYGWNDEGNLDLIAGFVVEYDSVPEPTTVAVFALGLVLLGFGRLRHRVGTSACSAPIHA